MMNTDPGPITVVDFGADPSGETDSTHALQRYFCFMAEMAAVDLEEKEGKLCFRRRGQEEEK